MSSDILLTNLAKDNVIGDDDYVLVFGESGGTRKMKKADFGDAFLQGYSSKTPIGFHRMPRREGPKNLGTSINAAQKKTVKDRVYLDMFVGDYWVIGGTKRIIADVDYFHNTGNGSLSVGGDLLMVNEGMDLTADGKSTIYMNDTATTEGGLKATKLIKTIIPNNVVPKLTSAFGDFLYTHKEYVSKTTEDGIPTEGEWINIAYLPFTETMLFGSTINAITNGGAGQFNEGLGKTQVSLFRYFPEYINKGKDYWLRESVSSKSWTAVSAEGLPYFADANSPYFGVWGYYVLH